MSFSPLPDVQNQLHLSSLHHLSLQCDPCHHHHHLHLHSNSHGFQITLLPSQERDQVLLFIHLLTYWSVPIYLFFILFLCNKSLWSETRSAWSSVCPRAHTHTQVCTGMASTRLLDVNSQKWFIQVQLCTIYFPATLQISAAFYSTRMVRT